MKHIRSDFYREVSPPDSLSSMSTGTPSGKSDNPDGSSGEGSSLPNGDGARNIGRPSPDSPNLKTKNLDRSESYGRKPAEGFDGGYVHDSGSGSARVIPYDSGYTNNSSPLRNAKRVTKEAVGYLLGLASKTSEVGLSKALERNTMGGILHLGSLEVDGTWVDINIRSTKKQKRGQYEYNSSRRVHEIRLYVQDQPISKLKSAKREIMRDIYTTLIRELRRFKDARIDNTIKKQAKPPKDIDKPKGASKKNVPLDEKLWAEIQALAKGESSKPVSRGKDSVNPVNEGKGFETFPSAYANGWALAQYKRLGGKWKKASFRVAYKNCYTKEASSLIPPPPCTEDLVCQIPNIISQYGNRYNSDKIQPYLDECFWKVFDAVLTSNGHGSIGLEIKDLGESLVPLILSLKDHFNLLRPNQLAEMIDVPFKCDYLETAQTPSYPSGHTTQAYYIAHVLSDRHPQLRERLFSVAKMVAESRVDRGVHFISDNEAGVLLAEKLFYIDQSSSRVAYRHLESAKRDDPKKKNTGKGGLGTWFAGHGGGDPDDRATWGDWIAVTPVKHTITKEDGKKKTYEPGDIVGPCAISSEKEWSDVTSGGKKPLKCMPREKAWKMPKKDRAELAKKKRREEAKHRGKKPVNTPTFSEEAKEVTKKKASVSRVAYRYLQSASQPAQDLGGVKTWVDKNRQDQVQNDTSSPDKSREDYEDGKPQRDRVLPLPSGHPEGRDEHRVGPGQINSPPDSSGQGGANRPKKDPAALSDHPNDKALHERPRSSGVPGDEYGNPYIDQSKSTGLTRRVMASINKISYVEEDDFYSEEEDFYWDVEDGVIVKNALFRYNFRPPRGDKRQREQKGQAKRKSLKNKRKNRVTYRRNLVKQKRLYKRKKHNPTYKKYKKNYAKNPERYKRKPGGGVSTSKQKSQRAEKRSK